jgi:hypothetical protein
MPVSMRPAVLKAVNQAWKKGAGIGKITEINYAPEAVRKAREEGRCDGGVWEVGLKDTPWAPASADRVSYVFLFLMVLLDIQERADGQLEEDIDQPLDDICGRRV